MTSLIVRINIGLMIVIALQVTSFFFSLAPSSLVPFVSRRRGCARLTRVLPNGILLTLLSRWLSLSILYCPRSERRASTICATIDWTRYTGRGRFLRNAQHTITYHGIIIITMSIQLHTSVPFGCIWRYTFSTTLATSAPVYCVTALTADRTSSI
jgi:hypothetical protein